MKCVCGGKRSTLKTTWINRASALSDSLKLVGRAVFFTLLMPGTVSIFIPYFILHPDLARSVERLTVFQIGAGTIGLAGFTVLIYSIWGFALHGKGTLAPIDPPRTLVVRGLYRHTRNPMYIGVLTILLAESALFQSTVLLTYAGTVFVLFHLFVIAYEEPHLSAKFGEQYTRYCRAVPRWWVTIKPFQEA